MNTYSKFAPNVFLAKCTEKYEKGAEIQVTTKYGKENECIVFNLIYEKDGFFFYSIVRSDGFNNQERAKNKVDKLNSWAESAEKRSDDWRGKSDEGKDFLRLGEPIKIGHHSEKRHRALIERNWNRMSNAMSELEKAEAYRSKIDYWENKTNKIDLSIPESVDFYEYKLQQAKELHLEYKSGNRQQEHSFSMTYARKAVKDLEQKFELAKRLWK